MEKDFLNWIEEKVGKSSSINKEAHGDQSDVYRIQTSTGNYFIKISLKSLEKERERLEWLKGKLPVPKVIGFTHINDKDVLLLSAIEGKNLKDLSKEWPVDKVIDNLVDVLHKFHAMDTKDFPFGALSANKVLVHGDACLPNFIFNGDIFSGYIDLGDVTIDDVEVDLAAAVSSLEYNKLGQGCELKFLQKYGVENPTEEIVKRLLLRYEKMQEVWGLK